MSAEKSGTRIAELSPAKQALLARKLAERKLTAAPQAIERRASADPAPLSFAQQLVWLFEQMTPGSATYNVPVVRRVRGVLDLEALRRALDSLIDRHEILRTTFIEVDATPVQVVRAPAPAQLRIVDLRATPTPAEREAQGFDVLRREAMTPFDLTADQLLRAVAVRLDDDDTLLLILAHHIAIDGASIGVLSRDLGQLYQWSSAEVPSTLPALPIQYADYAAWERASLEGAALPRSLAYWREQLAGAPGLVDLPTDRPRGAAPSGRGARHVATFPRALADGLKRVARQHDATPFMLLLAAFHALLHRYSGQDDIVVGSPIAGRLRPETEDLIGYFVNTLALRARFEGDPTFAELLEQVRQACLGAYEHQGLPHEKLVLELHRDRSLTRAGLFSVMFVLQDGAAVPLRLGAARVDPVAVDLGASKFDLSLSMAETADGLRVSVEYRSDLFDAATIERMVGNFRVLLSGAVDAPDTRVSQLPLLTEAERHQVLVAWNDTAARYTVDATIHSLVEAQVRRRPDAVAVECTDDGVRSYLTYGELDRRANRVAWTLRDVGVTPDSLVAVCLDRSVDSIVAILGVLKAGGAYLPLDPAYPDDRLEFTVRDAGATLLLTDGSSAPRLAQLALGARLLTVDAATRDGARDDAPPVVVLPGNLAYVIYTSGSTGHPKGVMVEHRNVTRLLVNDRLQFTFDEQDVWTVFHSFAFDFSVWELFGALVHGGRAIVVPRMVAQSAPDFLTLLEETGTTVLNQVPSAFYALMDEAIRRRPRLALRYVIFGGEALKPMLLREWRAAWPATRLVNMFGITETTVHVTYKEIGEDEIAAGASNIGRPIPTLTVYLLDATLQPVPVGVIGEICVGGLGVARGYLNRPELTAERFIADPFGGGGRLYRSGDRGRFRPSGDIEYLGRHDHQVKLRGHRIELGEIEAVLLQEPGVTEVATMLREDAPGDMRLAAYVVASGDPAPSAAMLRERVRQSLPEVMVPAAIVFLDSLPLTPNGKVDRDALPEPPMGDAWRAFVPPVTPAEIAVATAFADVLRVERVGVDDDFYELGGHSLLALGIAGRLQELFGIALSVRLVFEHSRVGALADAIDRELTARRSATSARVVAVSRDTFRRPSAGDGQSGASSDLCVFPASFAQARLFFIEELAPGRAIYNVPIACRLRGVFDVGALQTAVDGLCARHEVLRTTFAVEDDVPVQVVHSVGSTPVAVHDFTGTADADVRALSALRTEANTPFDLRRGPMIRIALFRVAADLHLLLITLHHVAADGWSVGVLQRELVEGYAAACEQRTPAFPPLPIQYADYAVWQRAELTGESLARLEAYWRERLRGSLPVLELPTRAPRPAIVDARPVQRVPFTVPVALAEEIDALARRERATPFMAYLAAFQLLLARYTSQDDIIVGTPMSGRGAPELEGVVGLFLNTLALRTDLGGDPTFRTLLARVREVTLGALAHDALPFERVIEVAKPARNAAITPIFQVMFAMQSGIDAVTDAVGGLVFPGLRTERMGAVLESTKFDLQLSLIPDGAGYRGSMEYDAGLFDAAVMERLASHFLNVVNGVAAAPDDPIGTVAFLDRGERDRIVHDWNATQRTYPRERDIIALVEEQVARAPELPAIEFEGELLTYAALDDRVQRLAAYLRERGVGPEIVVALYVQRSLDMVIGLLAILRAGGAYLPLDSGYPRERIEFMLSDSGAAVVVTEERLRERMTPGAGIVVSLDGERAAIDATPVNAAPPLRGAGDPDRLAYLIYTSGSTGKPKGVSVTHRNVVNFLSGFGTLVPLGPGQTLVAVTPLSFDIAGLELLLPLTTGARVVIASRDTAFSATALSALLEAAGATYLQATPATWRMLVDNDWPGRPGLVALCGGEALQPALANALLARGLDLWNLYGPTEATIWATMHHVLPVSSANTGDAAAKTVPIGRPMANVQAYVLDPAGHPAPVGVPGELMLGGDGIARDYHRRPDLTAERFVPDPFCGTPAARLYRTGDRARWRADGVLEFLGRFDDQVKLRGFRIELGEIESVLAAEPEVESSIVLVREDTAGDQRLVAYCVGIRDMSRDTQAAASTALREELKRTLPAYMIPNAFVWLDAWPLTPNGKLNRKALPAPRDTPGDTTDRPEPATAVETILLTIWEEVMHRGAMGIDDDFFDLGGHSLLAMQVVSRLSRLLDRHVTLMSFFTYPTVRTFAAILIAEEDSPGRTERVARALLKLRDMTPAEREQRLRAAGIGVSTADGKSTDE